MPCIHLELYPENQRFFRHAYRVLSKYKTAAYSFDSHIWSRRIFLFEYESVLRYGA